jgi:hypothetical protein
MPISSFHLFIYDEFGFMQYKKESKLIGSVNVGIKFQDV